METIQNEKLGALLLYEPMPYKTKGSIIICAGGAYVWLSPREEWPVAEVYAKAGYQSYILKYDVGSENAPLGKKPMMQLAWAVREARKRNKNTGFTVVLGFSAGGHLCLTLGTHWNDRHVFTEKESIQSKPDAMILGYTASELKIFEGTDFVNNLCGKNSEEYNYLNVIQHINENTPPAFIWHTVQDDMVNVQCSIDLMQKFIDHNVMAELHIFPRGVHGLSVATPDVDDPPKNRFADAHVSKWVPLSIEWLEYLK